MPTTEEAHGPAYRIHTDRLVIRCYNPADAPLLKAAVDASIEHLRPFLPWAMNEPEPLQQKVERLRQFRGNFDLGVEFVYGIFNPDETALLGGTGLHTRSGEKWREIGYWIHAGYTRRGLATEVAAALTRVAFEVDSVHRVEIHCDPANLPSAAVARRLGYTHEGTLRKSSLGSDGTWRDHMIWSLLVEEYPRSPCAAARVEAFDALGRPFLMRRARA